MIDEDMKILGDEVKADFFRYVTITVAEYRQMVEEIAQLKADKEIEEAKRKTTAAYDRAWKAEIERDELRTNLDAAKKQIQELLGMKELEQVKLADMQFEKGVTDAEQA